MLNGEVHQFKLFNVYDVRKYADDKLKGIDVMEDMIKQLEQTGDYRVLKRFQPVERYHQHNGSDIKIGIFIDVETTGLNPHDDQIIELAMVPFEFDSEGKIYAVLPAYSSFQDPGFPIAEEITQITGITDDMVKDQAIDMHQVAPQVSQAALVIAHNAGFDRPFLENLWDGFEDQWWACSINDINWAQEGMESQKLEYLTFKYGFFYEGHRAETDCQVGIHILSQQLPRTGELAFKRLLESARRTDYRLWAVNSPFEMKDVLKARGYHWSSGDDGNHKAWYIDVPEGDYQQELEYLNNEIYKSPKKDLPKKKLTAKLRYSQRI